MSDTRHDDVVEVFDDVRKGLAVLGRVCGKSRTHIAGQHLRGNRKILDTLHVGREPFDNCMSVLAKLFGCHDTASTRRPAGTALVLAEVSLSHRFVAEQLLGVVLEHYLAGFENVATVGNLQRKMRVLLDEENRDALRVDLLE